MRFLTGCIFFVSLPAFANSVTFAGYQFGSLYGSENLTIDGSGDLVVPTTNNLYGGATSLLPAGTQMVTTTFLDSAVTVGPAAELWVQDFTNPLTYEAAIGAFSGDADYDFEYRVDGVSGTFLSTGIARTAGAHSAAIAELPDGSVDFFLDNALVASVTAAQFGIPDLTHVVLTANGDAAGEPSTFTSFTVTTPEPSYLPCLIGIFAAFALVRKAHAG